MQFPLQFPFEFREPTGFPFEVAIDISKWQDPKNMDYVALKAKGIPVTIVKFGGSELVDPKARIHSQKVHEVGQQLGSYYWVDPIHDGRQQAEHYRSLIQELGPVIVAGDIEQWWADWDLWYQFRMGKIPESAVPKLSLKRINTVSSVFMHDLKNMGYNPLFYTSNGHMIQWGKLMFDWINEFYIWLAQYSATGGSYAKVDCSWEDFKAKYLPKGQPQLAKGLKQENLVIWQWTGDRFTLPYHDGRIDFNYIVNPKPIGVNVYLPPPAPTPIPPPATTRIYHLKSWVEALNVREQSNASSKILRVIFPHQDIVVTIQDYPNLWVKLNDEPGWVNSYYIE